MTTTRDLARKLKKVVAAGAEDGQQVRRARVVDTSPLTLEPMGTRITLEDFDISNSVERWLRTHDLEVDDVVLLVHEDEWVVTAVLETDADDRTTLDTRAKPGDGGAMPSAYKATIPAYDADGELIGRIPVI